MAYQIGAFVWADSSSYRNDLYVSYLEVITMHIQIPFLKNFAS